jgi:hypothetical protein
MVFGGVMFLASYGGFSGGSLGNLLSQWEAAGIFSYALPFLLIFALIFSILGFVPIFQGNKAINAIISLATALMALQFNFVSIFFAEIFPRLGVGLAVVLVLIILLGLLVQDNEKGNQAIKWMMGISIVVIAIVVISKALNGAGFTGFGGGLFGSYLRVNAGNIIIIVLILAGIIAAVLSQSPKTKMKGASIDISPLFGKGR